MTESISFSTESTAVAKIFGATFLASRAMEGQVHSGAEPVDLAALYAKNFKTIYRAMTEALSEK
jgi:hypothetical protein